MEFQVSLSLRARKDLVEIGRYIAKDNPDRASSFCRELTEAALALRTFAERSHTLNSRRSVRKLPYESYLIFYKIDESSHTVEILRFWHASRNQRYMRLKEEDPAYGDNLELRRHQLASGEGAVIPGDEILLQSRAQSQQ